MHIQVDGVMFQNLFKIWLMNFVFESQHRIHIEHVYVSDHDRHLLGNDQMACFIGIIRFFRTIAQVEMLVFTNNMNHLVKPQMKFATYEN